MGKRHHLPGHVTWTSPKGLKRIEGMTVAAPVLSWIFQESGGLDLKQLWRDQGRGRVSAADLAKGRHQEALLSEVCAEIDIHALCCHSSPL